MYQCTITTKHIVKRDIYFIFTPNIVHKSQYIFEQIYMLLYYNNI